MTLVDPQQYRYEAWMRAAMWAIFAIAAYNALAYLRAVSNPLISSDNWLFVDTFLRHAIDGNLDFGDFLVKRAGVDHAQPLNKLLMWWNYRYFDLDFMVEGMVGLGFACAGVLVLYRMAGADAPRRGRPLVFYGLMAAVAAVYFSLNSSMTWSFSMVTLGFVPLLFAFLTVYAAWHACVSGTHWRVLLATLAYGVVGDNSAILCVAAVSLTLIGYGWRTGQWRPALRVVGLMGFALAISRGIYLAFGEIRGETLPEFNVPFAQHMMGLATQWPDAWQWLVIPAASGIAYIGPLKTLFSAHWQAVQLCLAAIVLAGHGWFWWCAWRTRPRAAWFLAVSLMLLFYAYLTGVLYSRVFVRGAEYLDQPRYVSFYQLGIIALLLMGVARTLEVRRAVQERWLAVAAAGLMLVQLPLSYSAAQEVQHISRYEARMARQLGWLAQDPANPPGDCVPALSICLMPTEQRVRILRMLQQHRINLFSPRFAQAHPRLAAAADVGPTQKN